MMQQGSFTRKKALLSIFVSAAAILLLIFLRWHYVESHRLMTTEGREMFLKNLGWEIDTQSESFKSILLPSSFEGVLADYNSMQQQQGLDLSAYAGKECSQYTYRVTNYASSEDQVYITIYLLKGRLIAGDVHSNGLSGFMHGIYRKSNQT